MDPGPTLYHHPNEILEGAFKAELQQSRIIVMASLKDQKKKTVWDSKSRYHTHVYLIYSIHLYDMLIYMYVWHIYIYIYTCIHGQVN